MKHTETPWATDGTRIYRQANPGGRKYYLAETFGDVPCVERRSNAAHIVHCVNAHDGLVAALREVVIALTVAGIDTSTVRVSKAIEKALVVLRAVGQAV